MHLFAVALMVCVAGQTAIAQFNYDKSRIAKIRWTPKPQEVNGLKQTVLDLDGSWDFSTQPGATFFKDEKPSGWNKIDVPGEWVMQGFEVKPGEAAGYTREFEVGSEWANHRIKLKCEAIYSDCQIWINGKEAGKHLGGFTPFEFDVTNLVQPGNNRIAVAVKSESLADSLSNASNYAVHPLGGILRSIYLLALPQVNVASLHVGTTFDAAWTDAELTVETTLANESGSASNSRLDYQLIDADGRTVAIEGETSQQLKLEAGAIRKLNTTFKVRNPKKWDPEHPNLYRVVCRVNADGTETATTVRRFGFRQIEVRGNQVFVNNQRVKLRGVCRHEIDPLRGRSLAGNQWWDDVKLFRDGNVNYIRTSHYPPSDKLLDACDELGMFVEVEAPFCWASKGYLNDNNYFDGILLPTLEMVERDKSHPSILHWSLGNESVDYELVFAESARLVREADSSRPLIFSSFGPDNDDFKLDIGNHHYPGPTGPEKYRNGTRPMVFDEYLHLNAYNRYELMTDPGIRDFWGDLLYRMWEEMYQAQGVLGGALWAGIDDSFFLPDGHVVGYGTWGPIDGWRRPKPEYWHMKKVYSPVKIKLVDGAKDSLVTLAVENRFLFSNLDECKINWTNKGDKGTLVANVKPGGKQNLKLPFTYGDMAKLAITVWHDSDVAVDEYLFGSDPAAITTAKPATGKFTLKNTANGFTAQSSQVKVAVDGNVLTVQAANGQTIIDGWPVLMLVRLNDGGDTQMTKKTPQYSLYSPAAANRAISSVEVEKNAGVIRLVVNDSYDEAVGGQEIGIYPDGRIELAYQYKIRVDLNLRQWGMAFNLPMGMDQLDWSRKGLWSVYAPDHIGRTEGTARLFYGHPEVGLAGPATRPSWSYAEDQTRYGSNDFRSTKRNILSASLRYPNGPQLTLKSDGMQDLRAWTQDNVIRLLVAEYDNPGAERFLRGYASHASRYDQPLLPGQRIAGKISFQIKN